MPPQSLYSLMLEAVELGCLGNVDGQFKGALGDLAEWLEVNGPWNGGESGLLWWDGTVQNSVREN